MPPAAYPPSYPPASTSSYPPPQAKHRNKSWLSYVVPLVGGAFILLAISCVGAIAGAKTHKVSAAPAAAPAPQAAAAEHDSADQGIPGEIGSAVRIVLQDVSGEQQMDEQLRRTQAQASAQRMRLAAEHELTRELMDLVYPP